MFTVFEPLFADGESLFPDGERRFSVKDLDMFHEVRTFAPWR